MLSSVEPIWAYIKTNGRAIHFEECVEEIIDVKGYLDWDSLYCLIQEEKVVKFKSKEN